MNERLQEIFLFIGDKTTSVSKRWWYALLIALVLVIPFYFLIKFVFVKTLLRSYVAPQIIYSNIVHQPLQIIDKKIFELPGNSYSGYVKVKNIELEWGAPQQGYVAEFATLGGTVLNLN